MIARSRQSDAERAAAAPPSPRDVNPPLPPAWQPPQPTAQPTVTVSRRAMLLPPLVAVAAAGPLASFIHDPVPPSGATGEAHNWTMIPPVRYFYIDNYGADSTGLSLSDLAWQQCYAAAVAQVQSQGPAAQATGGAMIQLGAGVYQFSPGVVTLPDRRIGLQGLGCQATRLITGGSNGIIVDALGVGGLSDGAAPIRDFTVDGAQAGPGITGLRYGNRNNGYLTGIVANGCTARGFWFNDVTNHSEGATLILNAVNCGVLYDVDHADLDYSQAFLHAVATLNGNNNIAMRVINNSQISGSGFRLAGNITASNGFTSTGLVIGASGSDTSFIGGCRFDFTLEADSSAGTIQDVVIQGASGNAGLRNSNGIMNFINVGAAFTAGSVTAPAVFTFAGFTAGPLFSSHGTRTQLGTGGALQTYNG